MSFSLMTHDSGLREVTHAYELFNNSKVLLNLWFSLESSEKLRNIIKRNISLRAFRNVYFVWHNYSDLTRVVIKLLDFAHHRKCFSCLNWTRKKEQSRHFFVIFVLLYLFLRRIVRYIKEGDSNRNTHSNIEQEATKRERFSCTQKVRFFLNLFK